MNFIQELNVEKDLSKEQPVRRLEVFLHMVTCDIVEIMLRNEAAEGGGERHRQKQQQDGAVLGGTPQRDSTDSALSEGATPFKGAGSGRQSGGAFVASTSTARRSQERSSTELETKPSAPTSVGAHQPPFVFPLSDPGFWQAHSVPSILDGICRKAWDHVQESARLNGFPTAVLANEAFRAHFATDPNAAIKKFLSSIQTRRFKIMMLECLEKQASTTAGGESTTGKRGKPAAAVPAAVKRRQAFAADRLQYMPTEDAVSLAYLEGFCAFWAQHPEALKDMCSTSVGRLPPEMLGGSVDPHRLLDYISAVPFPWGAMPDYLKEAVLRWQQEEAAAEEEDGESGEDSRFVAASME